MLSNRVSNTRPAGRMCSAKAFCAARDAVWDRVSLDAAVSIMRYSTHKVLSCRVNKFLLNERRDGWT